MTRDGRQPEESGFLARWSREKAKTRDVSRTNREESMAVPVVKPDAGAIASDDVRLQSHEHANDAHKPAATTPELPPIESLTKDSDFTGFLADGVPDDLRRQALRRLWNVDPLFGTQCNLDIFIDDYTKIIPIDIAKDTIYKVGLGFCEPEDFMTDEEKEESRRLKAVADGVREPDRDTATSEEQADDCDTVDAEQNGRDTAAAESPGAIADDRYDGTENNSKTADVSSADAESVPVVVLQRKPA